MNNQAVLGQFLRPVGQFDLIRLGSDSDGGYLVVKQDVENADILVSLGICDDWSFEAAFLKANNVPLEAFDGSISLFDLFKMFIKSSLQFFNLKRLSHSIFALASYKSFFSGTKRHHKYFVGYDKEPNFIALKSIFDQYVGANGRAFLKIDIEGWEYRILDDLLAVADRLSGLVIEFHDVDLHSDSIERFVNKLPLDVAHVHCNNFADINPDQTPLVIEVSFSNAKRIADSALTFPHRLDSPNNVKKADYQIAFK